jgi:hypothetical protein
MFSFAFDASFPFSRRMDMLWLTWCTSQFQWEIKTVTSGTCIFSDKIRCKPDGAKYIVDGIVDGKPSDHGYISFLAYYWGNMPMCIYRLMTRHREWKVSFARRAGRFNGRVTDVSFLNLQLLCPCLFR